MIFTGSLTELTVQRGETPQDYIARGTLDNNMERMTFRAYGWKASDFADIAEVGTKYTIMGPQVETREQDGHGRSVLRADMVPYTIDCRGWA